MKLTRKELNAHIKNVKAVYVWSVDLHTYIQADKTVLTYYFRYMIYNEITAFVDPTLGIMYIGG